MRVDQRSPRPTGKARVSVPVVTISPALSGGLCGSRPSTSTRCASAWIGPSSTLAADALVDCFAVPVKRDSQGGKRRRKAGAIAFADRSSRPDEKRPMQPAICDAVGSLESPAGKDRLHDLETVRDPSDRSGDLGQAHPRCQVRLRGRARFPARSSAPADASHRPGRPVRSSVRSCRKCRPKSARRRRTPAHMLRLVKPILRPIDVAPCSIRNCRSRAVTA